MHTNVKTRWVDGDLVFYDKSGNEIFRVDGTNRKVIVHASAQLEAPLLVDAADLAAGSVVAAKLEEQVERIADVTITSAEILALNATPITLIAAPGADKAIIFEGAVLHKPAGTAYGGIAAGEDLSLKYTDDSGLAVGGAEMTGFADDTGAQTRHIRGYAAASAISSITPVANAALVAHMLVGEITTGDSDFLLRIYYRIVPTVLT